MRASIGIHSSIPYDQPTSRFRGKGFQQTRVFGRLLWLDIVQARGSFLWSETAKAPVLVLGARPVVLIMHRLPPLQNTEGAWEFEVLRTAG